MIFMARHFPEAPPLVSFCLGVSMIFWQASFVSFIRISDFRSRTTNTTVHSPTYNFLYVGGQKQKFGELLGEYIYSFI
jgi:hypothetical protein